MHRSFILVLRIAVSGFIFITLFLSPQSSHAAIVAGYSEYYLPGSADQLFAILLDNNAGISGTLHNVITIPIATDNVTVYYDHWENGYGTGVTGNDESYTANQGTVFTFVSDVPSAPRSGMNDCAGSTFPAGGTGGSATHCYDGKDRIYVVGGAVSVAQAFWPTGTGTVYANAWEVYPVKPYATSYTIPAGEDLFGAPRNYTDFQNVYVLVQATQDGTILNVDNKNPAPGRPQAQDIVNLLLNKGQVTQIYDVWAGTTVTADKPVQVQFIVGRQNAGYDSRSHTAVPNSLWDTQYYSPVPSYTGTSPDTNVNLYIFNPTASSLTINYQDTSGSGSFVLPANSTRSYLEMVGRYVPNNSGVYLAAADGTTKFWAIGEYDTGSSTRNWGFSLIPARTLTNEYIVSWAPGTSDPAPANNGSPIYISPTQDNTTFFVDYSPADGVADVTYTLNRLQVQKVRDPDNVNSGMRIWATAPFSIVWGEDGQYSNTGNPYIDAGYTILPLNADWIDVVLGIEKTSNPTSITAAIGQVVTFRLTVDGTYPMSVVDIVDDLPAGWAYVNNSTNITITLTDNSVIPGGTENPSISGQVLTWANLGNSVGRPGMNAGEKITLEFQAQTTAVPPNYTINTGTVTGTSSGQSFTATDTTTVIATAPDFTVAKSNNLSGSALVGSPFTWTLLVANGSSSGLATFTAGQIVLRDNLPVGPTYGAVTVTNGSTPPSGTGTLNCGIAANVLTCTASGGTVTFPTGASFTVSFPVTPAAAGTLTNPPAGGGNVCQVDPNALVAESNEGNNNCSNSVTVVAPSMSVSKTANPASGTTVNPGDTLTYTITVNNTGGTTQNNIVVNDALSAGATYVAQSTMVNGFTVTPTNFTFLDQFGATAFDNSDGTAIWTGTPWTETNDDGVAGTGKIQINNSTPGVARFDATVQADVLTLTRPVNLAGASAATFTYDLTENGNNNDPGDFVEVDVYNGTSWTNLTTQNQNFNSYSGNHNILTYSNSSTQIRFVVHGYNGATPNLIVDNVQIAYTAPVSTAVIKDNIPGGANGDLINGVPPTLVTGTDDFDLPAGSSLTVIYRVIVDNPTAVGLSSIVNTASVSSDGQTQPLTSTTTHPLPSGTISGQVRDDIDRDGTTGGIADADDSGLAGATVTLYTDPDHDGDPADGVQVGTPVLTDATGNYGFANLPSGYYAVVETDPTGYTSVTDKDGDTTAPAYNRIPVGLSAGAANTGNNFLDVSSDRTPTADPDTNTATENGPAVNGNVLTNETSLGDEPTTVTAADQGGIAITLGTAFTTAGGGTLTLNSDGTYSYTPPTWGLVPPAGLVETFNYTITDADGDASSTTLTITVNDNDRLPVADPDTNTATENGPAVNGNVLTNETSLGDEPTTVTAADQGGTAITIGTAFTTAGSGTLTLNADGTYSYTPPVWDLVPPAGLVEVFNYTITDADGDTSSTTLTITVSDNDRTPVADPDTDTALENGLAVNGNALTNETSLGDEPATVTAADQGGTAITIGTGFTTAGGGILTLNSDGTYAYTPPAWNLVPPAGLVEVFNYTITDVDGDTSSTTLTITVSDNDRTPAADPDTDMATENGPGVNGNVLTNETSLGDEPTTVTAADQGGTAMTIGTAFTTSGGGTLTLNANGTYNYTPPVWDLVPPAGLIEVFNYTITDMDGDTDTTTLTITVTNNDRTPSADPDTDTAIESGPAVNGNVLTNETSLGDEPTTVTAADQGGTTITLGSAFTTNGGGTLALDAGGAYSYTPPAWDLVPPAGLIETFNYTITDADGDSSSTTLTITVLNSGRLPQADPDTDTATENGPAVNGNVLTNETSLGDEPTTVTAADQSGTAFTIGTAFTTAGGGTLTLNTDGTYSYTPPVWDLVPPAGLVEVFNYTIMDVDGDISSTTLTITVNDNDRTPTADPDTDAALESGPAVNGNVLTNETSLGDEPTTVTAADEGGTAITIGVAFTTNGSGTLTLNGDGSYSYVPPAWDLVPPGGIIETFNYTITDVDGDTSSTTLIITVNDNNRTPSADPDTDAAIENGPAANGNVLTNETSLGDQPTTVTAADQGGTAITIGAAFTTNGGGTLTLNANGTYSYTPPAWDLVPPAGLVEIFNYTITDTDGDTSNSTLTITVSDNDRTPTADPDTDTATENGPAVNGNVLTNETSLGDEPTTVTTADQGGTAITIGTAFTTLGGGSLTINSDGTYAYTPPTWDLVPPTGLVEVFNYTITDADGDTSTTTLTITVSDDNRTPAADPDTDTATENGPTVNGNVLTNESSLGDEPTTVTAADQGGTAIMIGTAFTTNGGGSLTINGDGTYSYTPPNWDLIPPSGLVEVFDYTITDADGDISNATLTITVNDSDRIPAADPDTDTATENGPAVNGNVLTNETSLGDEPTTVTVADQGGTAIPLGTAFTTAGGGTLTLNAGGTYSYAPPLWDLVPPAGLVEVFNYTITDVDGDSSSATLTITVLNSDRLPQADPDTDTAVESGPAVNGNVLTNETSLGDEPTTVTAADQGGTAITIGTAFSTTGGGSLTINSDGTYSYTPPVWDLVPPAGVVEVFNYTITDADGDTDVTTLTITVTNNDRLPVSDPDTDTAVENGPAVNGNVLTNETSLGDEPTTVTAADQGGTAITMGTAFATTGGGTLTLNADGTYSYTPPAWNLVPPAGLVEVFDYTITDADGDTSSTTLTITVSDSARPPIATNNESNVDSVAPTHTANMISSDEGNGVDSDPDGDPLTVTGIDGVTDPLIDLTGTYGTLNWAADGSYTYTLNMTDPDYLALTPGSTATETFTYTLSDSNGGVDTAQLIVTVVAQSNPTALTKLVDATSETSTSGTALAIGEIVTYRVTVNVPPGTFPTARLVDTMERGLSFMDCVSITGTGLTTSAAGGLTGICSAPTVDNAGGLTTVDVARRVSFDFGTLSNGTAADQTLVVTYRAVVLDSAGNTSGISLDNSAEWTWAGGSLGPVSETVVVVEADLSILKTANTSVVSAGAEITMTLTIQHTADSETDAFDVVVTDALPAGLQYVPGSLECTSGAQDADVLCAESGGTITAQWSSFALGGGDGRVTFRVTVVSLPAGGITNTANVAWTSLPGDVSAPQNANVFSTERDYDPGSQINVYGNSDSLTLGVPASGGNSNNNNPAEAKQLPATGFAPNKVTNLSNLPREAYAANGVTLEIPSLGVKMPIVGVPFKNGDWNVTWLGKEAGWLEGTAFPSWKGNSVITSHVYSSNGLPGPFVNLSTLKYGEKVIVHVSGQKYIYEVRSNEIVSPSDTSAFRHEEKAWLTLVTCKEYDEKTNSYRKRVVIRAVLVSVTAE